MLKIDNTLLEEVGLGALPDAEKNSFLRHIYETLEMRVGIRLADQMSNEQLDEFERYFEAKDDAGAFKWLETNFPNYKEIVQEEFDKLKTEVAQQAPQILAASQSQAGAAPTQPASAAPAPEASAPAPTPMPDAQTQPYQPATPAAPPQPQYSAPPQPPVQPAPPPVNPAPTPPPAQPQPNPVPPANNPPQPPVQPPYPPQQPPAGPANG